MKIGICTQPLSTNYGGILQNYALQTILKRMGHVVYTFDINKLSWLDWVNQTIRVLLHKLLFQQVNWVKSPYQKKKEEFPLRRFVYSNINLTQPRTKWFEKQIVKKYNFDALIVGSDQVWRPLYNTNIEDLFLSFVQDLDLTKIAYAASFGSDNWELSDSQTTCCSKLAKQFKAISVREESAVNLCLKYLNVHATHVLDPTLLLSDDDYKQLCSNVSVKSPFVFAYLLDQEEFKVRAIKDFAAQKGLPCFIMSAGPNVSESDSVEKWLSYFRDSSYVITDSFHGTVFSLIFRCDFYVFGNEKRGNSRFISLLSSLNLTNRIVEGDSFDFNKADKLDWNLIHDKIKNERERCIKWISDSITN